MKRFEHIANKQNFRTKKHLGQNFLKDEIVLNDIANLVDENFIKNLQLIEIGIGLGDLSKRLLQKGDLLAYEIDEELIALANKNFKSEIESKRFTIIHKDVLSFESKKQSLCENDYFLVSNLPYYIATRIILNCLKDSKCKGFIVMTQKEVALKFCSIEKSRDFCALGVIIQSLGKVKLCFDVAAECFSPAPKVESSVFSFIREKDSLDDRFYDFLKLAFCAPRKKLKTNLKSYLCVDKAFNLVGLNELIRANEVSLKQYDELFKYLIIKD